MKDSGVEWIGVIPNEWKIIKLKYLLKIISGNGFSDKFQGKNTGNFPFCKVSDINGELREISTAKNYVDLDDVKQNKYNVIPRNSILIAKIGEALKKNHRKINTIECIIDNNMQAFSLKKDDNTIYIYYLLDSIDMLWFDNGGTIPSINNNKLSNFYILNTDILAQTRIASFLDTKCSLIDSTIEKEREVIKKLKEYRQAVITEAVTKGIRPGVPMKDSGIEWIGEIPSDWSIGKIKYTTSKIGSGKTPKGGSETYSEEGILFLRSQNIYDNGLNIEEATFISENIDEEMANTRVYPDDVLLNITGASIGRCCLYPSKMPYANVNQHVCIIRVIVNTMIPEYVHYFWISSSGQTSIDIYQSGANREGLNFEQIGNTVIPYPPLLEQQEIADYLDAKCSEIDATIRKRELAIEKLTAYKQSLIYECVTGKREVAG